MEKLALTIIVGLAIAYGIMMVVFSIAALPLGVVPLLGLFAAGLFFFKAMKDKINNTEDKKYNDKVDP